MLLDEPSVVAMNTTTHEVLAVGHEAKRMIGRTPDNISAIRPLKDGVIADFDATEQMLRYFIQQVHRRRYFAKPRLVICVPSGITTVEHRAVKEAGYLAGARRVYIVEEPMAAAIGAGLPIHEATGNMVVDIGGGTTEVAVISLGGVVSSMSVRTAGDELDQSVIAWMKKEHGLMLGEHTAEEIKMTLGSAYPVPNEVQAEVRGRDMVSGLPRTVDVSSTEIRHAMDEPVQRDRRRRPRHPRPDPARAGRRHHGPRHRAHRRRCAAARARRADPARDRDAGPRRPGPADLGRAWVRASASRSSRRSSRSCSRSPGGSAADAQARPRHRRGGGTRAPGPGVARPDHARRRATRSPVDPVRDAVGTAVGPVEAGAATAVRPFKEVARSLDSNRDLRHDLATLEAQNSDLRSQLATTSTDRNRLAEYDGLVRTARDTGYALVPARVVGIGPAQSFTRAVTIDAGTDAGVKPDSTVVNADGLVGRVVRASRSTATVLLIVDSDSVVGGRLGSTLKIGFIKGRGAVGGKARLDLDLVDDAATPARKDVVVSWGSGKGGPYVAGIPIGRIESVYSTPQQLSKQAVIDPFVDFSALDLVGVVVPRGTHGDRKLIHADGEIK